MKHNSANLIPKRFLRKMEFRATLQAWLFASVIVLVGCVVVSAQVRSRLSRREPVWERLALERDQAKRLMRDNELLQEQLASMRFVSGHLETLRPTPDALQIWGAVVATRSGKGQDSVGARNVRLGWLKLNLREAKSLAASSAGPMAINRVSLQANARSKTPQIQIAVAGDEQQTIHHWMGELERSDRVSDVRLGNSGLDATTGGFQSQIHASVIVEKELP